MINIYEVTETNKMVEKENLDVRTITLGINLLDCASENLDEVNEKIYKNRNASAMRKDAAQSLHEMFIGKVRCTDKTAIYDDRDEADTEETDFADEHLVRVMASKFGLTALGEVYEHENRKALGVS